MKTMRKIIWVSLCLGAAAAMGATAQEGAPESSPMREIKTTPAGAKVFLDWNLLGQTPLVLNDEVLRGGGLLVVHKPEHRASYRRIAAPRSFYLRLPPATELSPGRLLLRLVGPGSEVIEGELVEQLAAKDFYVHPKLDGELLEQYLLDVGGRDKEPFYAWARAHFGTRLWVSVYFPGADARLDVSRTLGLEAPAVAKPAPGEKPAAVVVLDVLDLAGGGRRHRAEVDGAGLRVAGSRARARAQSRLVEAVVASLQEWQETESEPDDLLLVIDAEEGELSGNPEVEGGSVAPSGEAEGAP